MFSTRSLHPYKSQYIWAEWQGAVLLGCDSMLGMDVPALCLQSSHVKNMIHREERKLGIGTSVYSFLVYVHFNLLPLSSAKPFRQQPSTHTVLSALHWVKWISGTMEVKRQTKNRVNTRCSVFFLLLLLIPSWMLQDPSLHISFIWIL